MINLAATILVVRDSTQGLEVLMVRRASRSSFMADAFVYPGGRVEPTDADIGARFLGKPSALATRLGVDPNTAVSIIVGAARETFEEAGLLIATRRGEKELVDLATVGNVADWRKRIHDGEATFFEFLEHEDLVIDDRFLFFAHWTTPIAEAKRFNTFFFVVKSPENQDAIHDEQETVDSLWCRPNDALSRHQKGAFLMFPPTFRTLERLSEFENTTALLCTEFCPPHILPFFVPEAEEPTLLLPGDPDFPTDTHHATATAVKEGPTRLVHRDGFWQHLGLEER